MNDQELTAQAADNTLARVRDVAGWLADPDGFVHPDGEEYGTGADALYDYVAEWPLELRFEKGQPFSVLLSFGGPNIWLTRSFIDGDRLVCAWGGDREERRDRAVSTVLDHFEGWFE